MNIGKFGKEGKVIEMGMSSNAQLIFGIELGESMPDEFGDDFEDYLITQTNIDSNNYKAQRAYLDKFPVTMEKHCSYDYPIYILAVNGAKFSAYRGDTITITPDMLAVDAEKIAAFKAWCLEHIKEWAEENNIDDEPKWLLCSVIG